jgi:SSS family transporter
VNDASTWFPGGSHLTAPDFAVLALLIGIMLAIGYQKAGGQQSTQDFFLARRSIPWWAACLSFVATEVSAVTIISVPATAYQENWQYAQFFIGSFAARAAIAFYFIPAFYRYNCTTIYEFLKYRFGPDTQYTATVFFFITRLLGSGVRLMAASLAVSVLLGWHILPAILVFSLIGVAYITYGGIQAVVWTGVLQAIVFVVAGLASLGYLVSQIPGGLETIQQVAGEAGRLTLWNWGPSWHDAGFWKTFFKDPNILWIAIMNGFLGSMAAFGTDHELMQRLLTVETRKASQRTMITTPFASFFVLLIFLSVGTCLYVFYQQNPALSLPAKADAIFPHFIGNVMPPILRGLLLGAVVMASIDSPLASLTASFVTDIYKPLIRKNAPDSHYLRVSRICVGVFAMLLAAIAFGFSFFQGILWLAFKIGGITFGSLLGVFLLGIFTERRANRGNVIAMITMALINMTILILSEQGVLRIAWTWLVLIGTAGTFALGWILGPVLGGSDGKTEPAADAAV